MATINKTTLNFANKRGLDITEWSSRHDDDERIAVWSEDNEMEPLCFYSHRDGRYFFDGACVLPAEIKEELPYWVRDERHLREVLQFISESMVAA